jgi:DNA (cytosine-5)-methyltransferase 1
VDHGTQLANQVSEMENDRLLPTPTAQAAKHAAPTQYEIDRHDAGEQDAFNLWVVAALLPTPKSSPSGPDFARADRERSGGDDLATVVARDSLMPTPRASEWKGTGPLDSKSHQHRLERGYLDATVQEREQRTGALNPEWVEWLMGFPAGWTDLGASGTR